MSRKILSKAGFQASLVPSFLFRITEGFAFQTDLYKPALPSANTSFKDLTALDPMIKGLTVIGIFLINPERVVFLPEDQTGGPTCDFDLRAFLVR